MAFVLRYQLFFNSPYWIADAVWAGYMDRVQSLPEEQYNQLLH